MSVSHCAGFFCRAKNHWDAKNTHSATKTVISRGMSEMDTNQFTISQASVIPAAIAIPQKTWNKKMREVTVRKGGYALEIIDGGWAEPEPSLSKLDLVFVETTKIDTSIVSALQPIAYSMQDSLPLDLRYCWLSCEDKLGCNTSTLRWANL